MRSPIDDHGNLTDFIPIAGDPPQSPQGISASRRQRWGARYLMTNDPALAGGSRLTATFVDTPAFEVPRLLNVQFRFALNGLNNLPIVPFSPIYPLPGHDLTVTVRRGVDGTSPTFAEDFQVQAPVSFSAGSLLPFDTVACRQLTISAKLTAPTPHASVWVEAIATPVGDVATRSRVVGWQTGLTTAPTQHFAAATHGTATLLIQNPTRVQFIIVNTSTDADLYLGFNLAPSIGPPPIGSIVLPKGLFSTYESPVGGFRGNVFGTWVGGVPSGGALCTDGEY